MRDDNRFQIWKDVEGSGCWLFYGNISVFS